jgi:hypothetical protein
MNNKRSLALAQAVLVFPAVLFMGSVVLRYVSALHDGAQRVVMWYAGKQWTLWLLLVALPIAVLVSGAVALLASPNPARPQGVPASGRAGMRPVAGMTVTAWLILVIVALHVLAD